MIAIIKAYFIESPLFEVRTEDGIEARFNLQIVAEEVDGNRRTHYLTFDAWNEKGAQAFADKVEARGTIDPALWNEGTSWDHYATPQTYQEEQEAAK